MGKVSEVSEHGISRLVGFEEIRGYVTIATDRGGLEVPAGVPHIISFSCQVGFSLTRIRSGSVPSYSVSGGGRGGGGEGGSVEGQGWWKGRMVCQHLEPKDPCPFPERGAGRDPPLPGWMGRKAE